METMEEVNEVLVATAEAVKNFASAVEKKMEDFTDAAEIKMGDIADAVENKMGDFKETLIETEVSLVKSVETSVEEVDITLKKAQSNLQEIKREEIVQEVKPKLRRETFENSSLLSRVAERPFLLLLLIIVQVPMKMLVL